MKRLLMQTKDPIDFLIGKTKEDAEILAKEMDCITRIVSFDGHFNVLTRDVKINRINLTLINNKVVKANIG